MNVLVVGNNIVLPNPSSYDITYKDLESSNSFTSETGIYNRDMIRANQVTISAKWERLSQLNTQFILNAISGKESIQVRYWDYYSMSFKTGSFFSTDRQVGGLRVRMNDGKYSIAFNFVEF